MRTLALVVRFKGPHVKVCNQALNLNSMQNIRLTIILSTFVFDFLELRETKTGTWWEGAGPATPRSPSDVASPRHFRSRRNKSAVAPGCTPLFVHPGSLIFSEAFLLRLAIAASAPPDWRALLEQVFVSRANHVSKSLVTHPQECSRLRHASV